MQPTVKHTSLDLTTDSIEQTREKFPCKIPQLKPYSPAQKGFRIPTLYTPFLAILYQQSTYRQLQNTETYKRQVTDTTTSSHYCTESPLMVSPCEAKFFRGWIYPYSLPSRNIRCPRSAHVITMTLSGIPRWNFHHWSLPLQCLNQLQNHARISLTCLRCREELPPISGARHVFHIWWVFHFDLQPGFGELRLHFAGMCRRHMNGEDAGENRFG